MTGGGAGSTPDKNGDMFQAPPRRDYVSPFEPGRDRPQRAQRSQSLNTPEQNGDMFQAPPRRDNVSPFEPEGSHGGLPLHGGSDGQPRHDDIVLALLQPRRGDRE